MSSYSGTTCLRMLSFKKKPVGRITNDESGNLRKLSGKGNLHLLKVRHKAEVRGSSTQQDSVSESGKQVNTDIVADW